MTTSTAPEVLRFSARLSAPANGKAGPDALLPLPARVGRTLQGMDKIEGTMNGQPFRAALEDSGLRVNKAMLRGARARIGDTVELAVLGPEPRLKIPADLRKAFELAPDAVALWKTLPDLACRDWVRWIDGAKTPPTRARRIQRTVEQLSEGKRRPCCVNFYEFMLNRIAQTEGR